MAKEITSDFLERLLVEYDPDIDLSEGGPAYNSIIQPILDRLDPDPLEVPFDTFAMALLADRYPSLSFREGNALAEAVPKPMQALMRPLLDQLTIFFRQQSLENWAQMSEEELDARLSNFLLSRVEGGYASGIARLYYENPVSESVGSGNVFRSKSGLGYFPNFPQNIDSDTMLTNKEGNLYYFDVVITAEAQGEDYNIGVGELTAVTGLSQVVSVTNLRRFRGGLPRETNEEAVIAAQQGVTNRSLATAPGIFTRLRNDISGIRHIRVVGYGDDEMTRDIIKGGSAGEIVAFGQDASTVNDGDGDDSTQLLQMPLANFTELIGPIGEITETWLVTFLGVDHVIEEVVSATSIKIETELSLLTNGPNLASGSDLITAAGSAIVESLAVDFTNTSIVEGSALTITGGADAGTYKIIELNYLGDPKKLRLATVMTATAGSLGFVVPFGRAWYLRQKLLTLSEIPGGFISEESVTIPDDTVHVGGMVDVYVSGDPDEGNISIEALADQDPVVEGNDLQWASSNTAESVGTSFEDAGVLPGYSLVIEEGAEAGVYSIIQVSGYQVVIDGTFSGSFTATRYHITDVVDVELTDPQEPRISGSDMKVTLGASTALTDPLVNFTDYGVIAGDYLRIEAGPDAGDYVIQEITGTGDTTLVLAHNWTTTQVNLVYRVYRKGEAVDPPIVSVDSVELQDSNQEPTGIYVPYAKPLRLEVLSGLENVGEGTLASYTNVQLGIIGSIDITTVSGLNGLVLKLLVDGTTHTITFTAAAVTAELVVDEIDDVIPDVAYIYAYEGEKRLTLQSVDRLIKIVLPDSTAVTILGFSDTREEYSDQILIDGGYVNLRDINATIRSVINVTSDPVGYYRISEINVSYGSGRYYSRAYSVFGTKKFWLATLDATVTVGNPSNGLIRAYFKDPTFFQVQGPRYFTEDVLDFPWKDYRIQGEPIATKLTATVDGAPYNFYPDSAKTATIIPADDGTQPNNGSVGTDSSTFVSKTTGLIDDRTDRIDFLEWGAAIADTIEITTYPLIGDLDLSAGSLSIDGKYLKVRVAGYLFTVTFDANDTTIDEVVGALNQQVGEAIANTDEDGANEYLVLESDKTLILESDGGANDATDVLLRAEWVGVNTTNIPSVAGEYLIDTVAVGGDHYTLTLATGASLGIDLDTYTLVDALNEAVANYKAHRSDSENDYHAVDDATNAVTASYPLVSYANDSQIITLWNDIVAMYDAHDANTGGVYHTAPGSQHQTGLVAAVSIADVYTQYSTFKSIFRAHLEDISGAGAHTGVDAPDTDDLLAENIDDNNNLHFKLSRRGCQRISPAVMSTQTDDNGFYYMDMEIASEGAGNDWNLQKGAVLEAEDYDSYGWWLTTGNEATSYSIVEELWMHFTPVFLPSDKKWDPIEAYSSSGQNYEVLYLRSDLVDEVHAYMRSEQNRNEVQNALARHLLPAYVYLAVTYTGGSQTSILEGDLELLIKNTRPDDALSVYELARTLSRRSAENMTNPTVLAALVWESDRLLRLERSENELDLGIRYSLYVGGVSLTRE